MRRNGPTAARSEPAVEAVYLAHRGVSSFLEPWDCVSLPDVFNYCFSADQLDVR